jgi:IS1 family transposase
MGADCETDYYLVIAKFRERLTVSKQTTQTFEGEGLNLRKPNEFEVRKLYQIKISKSFTALENLNVKDGINRALENMKENIKTSAKVSLVL